MDKLRITELGEVVIFSKKKAFNSTFKKFTAETRVMENRNSTNKKQLCINLSWTENYIVESFVVTINQRSRFNQITSFLKKFTMFIQLIKCTFFEDFFFTSLNLTTISYQQISQPSLRLLYACLSITVLIHTLTEILTNLVFTV